MEFQNRSQYWAFYKKNSKIETCFAQGIGDCSNKISSAHSLHKMGLLSQVEDDRSGGRKLYSLEEWIMDEYNRQIIDFKLVGKKAASIFTGFCDKHDVSLFSPIENNALSFTDKQLFLFYYRGFAHNHHNVAEQCKFKKFVLDNFTITINPESYQQNRDFRSEYFVFQRDFQLGEKVKGRLNLMLANSDFSEMSHYYRIIPYTRIASSQRIVPPYTYSGEYLKRYESTTQVVLTIIPDHNQTVVLFSHFIDDFKGKKFVDELKALNLQDFTQAVTSILMYSGMNTYFAPSLWDEFRSDQKEIIVNEVNYLIHFGHEYRGFFRSKVNLFEHSIK